MTVAPTGKEKTKRAPASNAHKKTSVSKIGAPAQHNQASRKGKKAWRKNVDLEDMEEKLEGLREEQRIYGTTLQEKKDEDLFVVDTTGDDKIRRLLPKFSTRSLTAHKILSQRSAVPAVFSRPTSTASTSSNKRPGHVTRKEKERLLKIARKDRRGPLNSYVHHDQVGEGSALMEVSNAVRESGKYDVWGMEEAVKGTKVKPPNVPHPHKQIALPAVTAPHAGTSYNPSAPAHTELLRAAHEAEEKRVAEREVLESVKDRILLARRTGLDGVEGMAVDEPSEDEEDAADGEEAVPKKVPGRKTKQQKRKAEKLRAEKRVLAERALRKRLLASVDTAKRLGKNLNQTLAERAQKQAERAARKQEKLRAGMAGTKLGKHRVPDGEVDVQLGEELSESLRGLKPEGNLFRDRFLSMQHRALIEPRAPIVPTKRAKTKLYEKHDFKRFE
ncbi:ribosome biogenesis protein Nop53/GLTSCR2 [Vararia minispora EC-137]|uniref:Ribosome biogenesis protein Nop53/GLTSCR2 n=1 Tax=Vararia minispora EC-137 TaxID=1314806 RepID=A0ACB8QMV8_9AGAM|nr:ribosome biogenesis protein Nop53/GLTSCR2 [Vararia minispora EC-137]